MMTATQLIAALIILAGVFFAGRAFQGYAYVRNSEEQQQTNSLRAFVLVATGAACMFASIGFLRP